MDKQNIDEIIGLIEEYKVNFDESIKAKIIILVEDLTLSELCQISLRKWNINSIFKISDYCPFCYHASTSSTCICSCEICICPDEICKAHATKGYVSKLIDKYSEAEVSDMEIEEIDNMRSLFNKYIKED